MDRFLRFKMLVFGILVLVPVVYFVNVTIVTAYLTHSYLCIAVLRCIVQRGCTGHTQDVQVYCVQFNFRDI